MSNSTHTYTGVWVDWSQGQTRGATLTLSQLNAGILSAFLAVLTTSAGGLFWSLVAFAIHQLNTTPDGEKQDVLQAQRQLIYRNKGTMSAALAFLKLPFAHRHRISKPFWRSLPFALLAILILLLFGASSLFTSYISKLASASTLIISPDCGGFKVDTISEELNPLSTKSLLDTYDAATYVRECYQGNPKGAGCGLFIRPRLPFTTNPNASCPFGDNLCAYNDQSAFQMDTGHLDSHLDFGINARPRNRIKFRRVSTCAPIHHHSSLTTVVNDTTQGILIYVNAGPQPILGLNYTFVHTPVPNLANVGYLLRAMYAGADPTGVLDAGGVTWQPDPVMNQTNADITLMMLSQNDISYVERIDDPWITAQTEIQTNSTIPGSNESLTLWLKSYDISLLGCVDQYQVCNPNMPGDSGCTTLGGLLDAANQAYITKIKSLGFNSDQIVTISRFFDWPIDMSMYSNVDGRGGSALNDTFPQNQWQIEVSTWFATSLAKQQTAVLEWATTPKNLPSSGWHHTPPTISFLRSQCHSQLVLRGANYENFSVLGLSITVALCGVIVILGLIIDTVVGWLRPSNSKYMRDQWEVEETLSLHEAAFQKMRLWSIGPDRMVPSSALLDSTLNIPLQTHVGSWNQAPLSPTRVSRDDSQIGSVDPELN
ncbi:uncharacterized protein N7483_008014 [Penicillium malachiteum]|uniref:uncharacterized protein n=1 Tax=Penicillium malachiteum TaxID=1324776 RepID=UPI002548B83E|nr:uncharacterized protein N7483_008014 [Penicillium malachiteum]KAJ5726657.1 hypothetical protein N7483_008014 [Penicillium malachiteum]